MTSPASRLASRLAALYALAIAALYARSMATLPFADDWGHLDRAHRYGFDLLFRQQFFRPFERLINALNYSVFDVAGPITIGCNILTLVATAFAIHRLARRLAPDEPLLGPIAALLFVAHPGNASAVIQIDTLSQCLATLFSVLCARYVVFSVSTASARTVGVAFALGFAALCAKETTVGLVAALPLAVYLNDRRAGSQVPPLRRAMLIAIALLVALALYLGIRVALGAAVAGDPAGRYAFTDKPLQLFANVVQMVAGSFYLGDTVHWRVWRWTETSAIGLAVSVGFYGVVAMGLAGTRRVARSGLRAHDGAILALLLLASLVPSILLNRVSEQYLLGLTPYAALIAAAGSAAFVARLGDPRRQMVVLAVVMLLTGAWGGYVIDAKQRLHAQLSARHWGFARELSSLAPQCPSPTDLKITGNLLDLSTGVRPYSVFSDLNGAVLVAVVHGLLEPSLAPLLAQESRREHPSLLGSASMDASHCEVLAGPCDLLCMSPDGAAGAQQTCQVLTQSCGGEP